MSKLFQPLVDKWEKWRRNRKYPENKYFTVKNIDTLVQDKIVIELLKGPYKGIIYSYGTISIDEDLGYKGARASFDIDILNEEMDPNIKAAYINDNEFPKIAGDILLIIMDKAIRIQADKFVKENLNEEVRENYIEEPVPERVVREENPSVPKKRVSSGKTRKNPVRRNTKVRSKVQQNTDT